MAERGTIDDFKAKVTSDFARPNLFQVDLAFPNDILQGADLIDLGKFTVRAANLPSSQVGVIEVPFRGRVLKIAGDRTFEPWSVTVLNDGEFTIRKAFEAWSRGINALTENVSQLGYGDDGQGYTCDLEVFQLSRDGKTPNKTPRNITSSYK